MARELKRNLKEGRDSWGENYITIKHFRKKLNKALKALDMDDELMHISSRRGFMIFVECKDRYDYKTYHIRVDEDGEIEIIKDR